MTLAACGWDWEASGFEDGGAAVPVKDAKKTEVGGESGGGEMEGGVEMRIMMNMFLDVMVTEI